ncbi:GIY-YIG nuclease family protein [Sporosarcina soli]|uniref:GIY-YIG nuclease family protein n=1 Tax=Sporosarcina soli TaxID=334736 RepID=A0ABW0TS17_9BACL
MDKMKYKIGVIYIATNKFIPNLLKIGMTTNIETRIPSMSNSSSVPGKFVLEYESPSTRHVDIAEKYIHALLHEYRVDLSKEFFNLSIPNAIRIIEKAIVIIDEEPDYLSKLFCNTLKNWTAEQAMTAVTTYLKTYSFLKVAPLVGKFPIEVESFLNSIGAANTQEVKSNSSFRDFPKNCYLEGEFEKIVRKKLRKS